MSDAGKAFGSVVDALEKAASLEDVRHAFLAGTENLGFKYVGLFSCDDRAPPSQRVISFNRMPGPWLKHYEERGYHIIDPVYGAVQTRVTPFRWDTPDYLESLTPAQKTMIRECDESGLMGGVAIPLTGAAGALGCCSLVPEREGIDPLILSLAHTLAVFAHNCARRVAGQARAASPTRLTSRERECLLLAARGKSDWTIGEVLGLSARTVHHTIERAKARYGVATRVQAIMCGITEGEFSATDTIA